MDNVPARARWITLHPRPSCTLSIGNAFLAGQKIFKKKHLINGWSEGIEATPNYCILIIPCVGFGLLRGQKKATNLNQGHERTHCNGSSAVVGAMASENKVRTATVAQVLHRRAKAAPK